jgi:hypothetical protein
MSIAVKWQHNKEIITVLLWPRARSTWGFRLQPERVQRLPEVGKTATERWDTFQASPLYGLTDKRSSLQLDEHMTCILEHFQSTKTFNTSFI